MRFPGRANLVLRVPPEQVQYTSVSDPEDALLGRNPERNKLVHIVGLDLNEPISGFLRETSKGDRVILLAVLNQDLIPTHALQVSKPSAYSVQGVYREGTPSEGALHVEPSNPPRRIPLVPIGFG